MQNKKKETQINLGMLSLKIFHESNKLLNTRQRHSIINRSSHTSHRPMPFKLHHLLLSRFLNKLPFQLRLLQSKRHIHQRPHRLLNRTLKKPLALFNSVVKQISFPLILPLHFLQPALLQQILKHEPTHVNPEARRRVVQGTVLIMNLVVKHHWSDLLSVTDQIFPDYHDRHTGRTNVLLSTTVDHTELRHINRLRTEVRRHVSHQEPIRVSNDRIVLKLNSMDSLVSAYMQILSVGTLLQRIERRNLCVLVGLTRPDHAGLAILLSFLHGFVTPRTGYDEIDGIVRFAEIERQTGELGRGPALQEQNGIFGGNLEELAEIRVGFLDDGEELFPSVAHLHHAHPRSAPVV
ncbi:hypothetical protein YC2023_042700 [Brassica napus]